MCCAVKLGLVFVFCLFIVDDTCVFGLVDVNVSGSFTLFKFAFGFVLPVRCCLLTVVCVFWFGVWDVCGLGCRLVFICICLRFLFGFDFVCSLFSLDCLFIYVVLVSFVLLNDVIVAGLLLAGICWCGWLFGVMVYASGLFYVLIVGIEFVYVWCLFFDWLGWMVWLCFAYIVIVLIVICVDCVGFISYLL